VARLSRSAGAPPTLRAPSSADLPHVALLPGKPYPLGAHWDGEGVNFAVFSGHAEALDLSLFDPAGSVEQSRTPLPGRSRDIWHGYLPGAAPGLVYGWRAHGPFAPPAGHRFTPHKLLLDPYAREIVGRLDWSGAHGGTDPDNPHLPDARDNAAGALKARVVHDAFDWEGDTPPETSAAATVLYELHVKGFTQRHPGVPAALRGSYAGLASDAAIAHLLQLGVSAVSLLPVHQHLDEERLVGLGLVNYWGYNTIGFFCPEPGLACGVDGLSPRDEFRAMVKRLHRAGIEVILDVVFNHTAESDETGPTLSFRGLDNAAYYRLPPHGRAHYENHSGCGNTLDLRHGRVVQLVLDSLRYWVTDMHVDGFRFDLAPVLGRGDHGFRSDAPFFGAIAQDPVLSRVKLIAEPWDIGPDGYRLGGFPPGWGEWNDRFRDGVRAFWLGEAHGRAVGRGEFAQRLCGSSDRFRTRHRCPSDSVNFVVAHDGFTLRDLVSFDERHNEANLEGNRDGHGHNLGWNCGIEGPTGDAGVNRLRARLQRALLATLLLAQGTPMLAAGDELGHTQGGNNNPYCQDNPTTWIDWAQADADLLAFTRRVLALRRHAQPFRDAWYHGIADRHGLHDLAWLSSDGSLLVGDAWNLSGDRMLGCLIGHPAKAGAPLLLLFNPDPIDRPFQLPAGVWRGVLDTSDAVGRSAWHGQGEVPVDVPARGMLMLAAAGAKLGVDLD
jgi:glycogen operon protein